MQEDPLKALRWEKRLDEATRLLADGKTSEARDLYQALLEERPNAAKALHGLALTHVQDGEMEKGESCLHQALQAENDVPERWNDLGEVLRLQGKVDDAVAAYEQALALKPDFSVAMSNCGVALYALGQLERAAEMFAQAIAIEPDSPFAYNNLGVLYECQGKFEQALQHYEMAVRLKHDFAAALANYDKLIHDRPDLLQASLGRMLNDIQAKRQDRGLDE